MSSQKHYEPFRDHGPYPYVVDIEKATIRNTNFRTTLWTGDHLQLTLMSIPVGESIEVTEVIDHPVTTIEL